MYLRPHVDLLQHKCESFCQIYLFIFNKKRGFKSIQSFFHVTAGTQNWQRCDHETSSRDPPFTLSLTPPRFTAGQLFPKLWISSCVPSWQPRPELFPPFNYPLQAALNTSASHPPRWFPASLISSMHNNGVAIKPDIK